MKVLFAFMVFIALPIAFVLGIGLFFSKNKVPGSSANASDELEKFKKKHPGKKGNIVYYGLLALLAIVITIRVFSIFKGY